MASKWDDEFDFEDEDDKNKIKKNAPAKTKSKNYENDFLDLEEDDNNKGLKLPAIGNRGSNQPL